MGVWGVLWESFTALRADPVLFVPKLISNTIWLIPYLYLLAQAKADISQGTYAGTLLATAGIFLLSPVWLVVDSMYPVLVEQRRKGEKLNFRNALRHVLDRFVRIFAFFLLLSAAFAILSFPFVLLLAFGYAAFNPILFAIGFLGLIALVFILSVGLYFAPSAIILKGKIGILDAIKESVLLSRTNFSLAFWLTLVSLLFFALAFALEGSLKSLGVLGFIAGRYLGGVVTVYSYVVNPSAYLDVVD